MSFRSNLKVALAMRLEERLAQARRDGLLDFVTDAEGREHAGPGPGGGQFVPKGSGGGGGALGDQEPGSGTSGFSGKPDSAVHSSSRAEREHSYTSEQFDAKGKPVPGSDAWFGAHGISKSVYDNRPYQRFEPGSTFTDLPQKVQDLYANEPEAKRQVENMMKPVTDENGKEVPGSGGGLIIVRSPVPGIARAKGDETIVPQTRPDVPVVTDASRRAYALSQLNTAKERSVEMEGLDKDKLLALQTGRVERAQQNLEEAKIIDRDGFLAYATARSAAAHADYDDITKDMPRKGGAGKSFDRKAMTPEQQTAEEQAKVTVTRADKSLADRTKEANHIFGGPGTSPEEAAQRTALYRELQTNNATKALGRAQAKMDKLNDADDEGIKEAIGREIQTAHDIQDSAQNKFDKTAAKYLFPPNPSRLKDDIESGRILGKAGRVDIHDEENVRNLIEGHGRVYLAMEGNMKEDAVISAVKREGEKGAAVISVPSVTLWRHQEMLDVANKYLKGREVVLIPDADGVNNPRVRNEARALQSLLEGAGAKVAVAPPPIPLKDGKPVHELDADGKPTSKIAEFETVIPGSPTGKMEHLKGVDDYLGLGPVAGKSALTGEDPKGTLGNLAVQRRNVPEIKLEGEITKSAVPNAEAALKAISLIAGSTTIKVRDSAGKATGAVKTVAAAQIGNSMLSAAMGKFNDGGNAARRSVDVLEKAGIVKVERVYDPEALARGLRVQNPDMTDERLDELVRAHVIARPSFGEDDTRPVEFGSEEVPIISINPDYKSFDGKVRNFTSTDETPMALEEYSKNK